MPNHYPETDGDLRLPIVHVGKPWSLYMSIFNFRWPVERSSSPNRLVMPVNAWKRAWDDGWIVMSEDFMEAWQRMFGAYALAIYSVSKHRRNGRGFPPKSKLTCWHHGWIGYTSSFLCWNILSFHCPRRFAFVLSFMLTTKQDVCAHDFVRCWHLSTPRFSSPI